jgi:hypothetical protein
VLKLKPAARLMRAGLRLAWNAGTNRGDNKLSGSNNNRLSDMPNNKGHRVGALLLLTSLVETIAGPDLMNAILKRRFWMSIGEFIK